MRNALIAFLVLLGGLMLAGPTMAQDAAAVYKGKCVGCHAADGTGSAIGKKMGTHDFHSPEVQKESDAELTAAISKGKNKMPGYEKSLKPDEIKALAEYCRSLGK